MRQFGMHIAAFSIKRAMSLAFHFKIRRVNIIIANQWIIQEVPEKIVITYY